MRKNYPIPRHSSAHTSPSSAARLSWPRSPQRSRPRSPAPRPRRSTSLRRTRRSPVSRARRGSARFSEPIVGTWTGTAPDPLRVSLVSAVTGAGAADASDCTRISNASDNTYVARQGDAGFRLRVQVIGRNAEGQDTATSNPTAVIISAGPTNTTGAVDLGHGRRRQHPPGQSWRVGGPAADHLLVRLAALQRPGRQLQRDPGCERHGVRGSRR